MLFFKSPKTSSCYQKDTASYPTYCAGREGTAKGPKKMVEDSADLPWLRALSSVQKGKRILFLDKLKVDEYLNESH